MVIGITTPNRKERLIIKDRVEDWSEALEKGRGQGSCVYIVVFALIDVDFQFLRCKEFWAGKMHPYTVSVVLVFFVNF